MNATVTALPMNQGLLETDTAGLVHCRNNTDFAIGLEIPVWCEPTTDYKYVKGTPRNKFKW